MLYCFINKSSTTDVSVKKYGRGLFGAYARKSDDAQTVCARAYSMLGEKKYDLVKNNCEHFSVYCKTGHKRSQQVESIVAGAAATYVAGSLATKLAVMAYSGVKGERAENEKKMEAKHRRDGEQGGERTQPTPAQPSLRLSGFEGEALVVPAGRLVRRAWYGDSARQWSPTAGLDVTKNVLRLVRAASSLGDAGIRVGNGPLGGDPCPGKRKILLVEIM